MSDQLTITVDTSALLAAIDAIPEAVHRHLKLAAKVTADHIAAEARGRVRRRTGKTAQSIHVEETHSGDGYVVMAYDPAAGRAPVDMFLEFGTKFMTAKPFLFASARLEEGAHDRRSREAIQAAIDEEWLGD